MSVKKFKDINTDEELMLYLKGKQRFSNIEFFSKYTKLSSVVELFSNEKMLINNPENMNDLYEYRAFKPSVRWDKICFASFIANGKESMAMWSMYGQPWSEGVMISIPATPFMEMIENTQYLIGAEYNDDTSRYFAGSDKIPNDDCLFLIRVAYVDGRTITCTGRDDRNTHFKEPYKHLKLAGYIKDAAWDYEKEVRLRVDLPGTYSNKAIYLKLPETLLKQMIITTGPRFEGNVLTSIPPKYRPYVEIRNSKFTEKLGWIPCDTCRSRLAREQNA